MIYASHNQDGYCIFLLNNNIEPKAGQALNAMTACVERATTVEFKNCL